MAEHLLATTSDMMFFFSFLQINQICRQKQFIWWSNSALRKGIHKTVQFCVIMEIRPKSHSPSSYYDPFKEKEDDLQRAPSLFVKITNFNFNYIKDY